MSPKRGIVVIDTCNSAGSASPRLQISDGTIEAKQYPVELPKYDPQARLPVPTWRALTLTEHTLLTAQIPEQPGGWISIVSISPDILQPFRSLSDASQGTSIEPLRMMVASNQFQPYIEQTKEYVHSLHTQPEAPLEGGFIFVGGSNRITQTYAPGPRYIGLHIDSFYQASHDQRAYSPNRICINLGAGDRYLYFINVPVSEMTKQVTAVAPDDNDSLSSGSPLGLAFMRHFPNYPVVKIRVSPGEAYIAPTENMIHDGSSLGNPYYDVHLTIRGHFKYHWTA